MSHHTAQAQPSEDPVLRLTCSTWMSFERLLRRHLLPRQMIVPAADTSCVGPMTVTVALPTPDVLTFNAHLVRLFYGEEGKVIAAKVQFPELTMEETQELTRFAARRERGWEAEPPKRFKSDAPPKSGVKYLEP